MKKFLLFIYFFSIILICLQPMLFVNSAFTAVNSQVQVTWIQKPVTMQLFARDQDDSAKVTYSGYINTQGYKFVYVELYKDQTFVRKISQTLVYVNSVSYFEITHKIKAELSEYTTIAYARKSSEDVLIGFADSLVAGDVYLIMGQSNAQTADTNVSYSSEYCRTFGMQTPNTNQDSYNRKDTLWAKSSAKYNGYTPITQHQPYNVCVWGMSLQRYIKDSCSIPTCLINGAVHSSGISKHLRKDSNPTDSSTIYGKTLYRVIKSGLASKIKSIFWYQGESDVTFPSYADYKEKFDSLYYSWKTDYPGVENIFVMQVRPLSCNGSSAFAQELRETQRQLEFIYPDVRVIATAGIGGYYSSAPSYNCHFHYTGYIELAKILFKRIGQLYYNATDTFGIRSPNIRKAWFTDTIHKKIGMLFDDSAPAYIPADSMGNSIKNYFYLDKIAGFSSGKISSVTLSGDTLFLNLNSTSNAFTISYIPDIYSSNGASIYNGPWIRNSRGLAMLTFDQVPIFEPDMDPTEIRIKSISEGSYLPQEDKVQRADSLTAYIRSSISPYLIIDSSRTRIDSLNFTGVCKFSLSEIGNYYLSIKNLNTIETWSAYGKLLISRLDSVYNYDFTSSKSQAYGNNLTLKGSRYCIYSGDVDQNGFIDVSDMVMIYNKSLIYETGNFIVEDLNADAIVDVSDITLCYNNTLNFIGIENP